MNKEDKRVLRRKRYTIASNLTLTDELLEELHSLHLINVHGRDQVKVSQGSNTKGQVGAYQRTFKITKLLRKKDKVESFQVYHVLLLIGYKVCKKSYPFSQN